MRTWLAFGSLCLVLVLASTLASPTVGTVAADETKQAEEDPAAGIEWKKDDGLEQFHKAHAAYESGDFKEARKLFKKAQGKTKDKASKTKVALWVHACKGGLELVRLEHMAKQTGKGKDALVQAERAANEYGESPIGPRYDELIAAIRKDLFHTLDDFEKKSGRFSEKQGKKFIKDEKMVKQGNQAIRWEIVSNPAELKIKKLPKNLSQFSEIWFWMHFPEKGGRPYEVTFMAKGKTEKERMAGKRKTNNGYRMSKPPHRGWQLVKLPLRGFSAFGDVSWKNVEDVRIRFSGAKGLVVHVDDIVLVK